MADLVSKRLKMKKGVSFQHPLHSQSISHIDLVEKAKHYFCHQMRYLGSTNEHDSIVEWNYDQNGEDWNIDGTEQSPIAIQTKQVVPSVTLYMKMWWNIDPITAQVHDNGHTVLVEGAFSRLVGTSEERTNSLYESIQFHFHSPSEHTFDDNSFPLELHFVHVITAEHFTSDVHESEDAAPKRHLAVLGVLWTVDDTAPPHPFIEALQLDNIGGGHSVELFMEDYFGHISRPEYYSYPGSLTMPPCSEIVNWFIVKKPETLTSIQLQKFKQFSEFRGCGNNRICQPLGTRLVCMGNCDYILDYEYASNKSK